MKRGEPCFCNSNKKWKDCCFPKKEIKDVAASTKNKGIILKTCKEIKKIRESCKITAKILQILCEEAKEGVSTLELDTLSRKLHKKYQVIPATLGYGYPPFPASVCISINDVICHGIPDATFLKKGDIVNIDVSCINDGYFGDCSSMVIIGKKTTQENHHLVNITEKALYAAINKCKPGIPFSIIGKSIEEICNKENLSIVKEFVGHGVGIQFHELPSIHHWDCIQPNFTMEPGMIFTIEPIITLGSPKTLRNRDQWSYRTIDGSFSAQAEHTILITKDSFEILTKLQ